MIKITQEGARFDPIEHRYYLNDRRVIGLTEALGSVGIKPPLVGIPQHTLERVRNRGTRIHLLTQLDAENDLGEYAPEDQGYLDAWRKFVKDHAFRPNIIEKFLIHQLFFYGGIPDHGCYLGDRPTTLEVKTTVAGVEPWVEIQTALQAKLLADVAGFKTTQRAAVALFEDGTYEFKVFKDHRAEAIGLAAVAIANYKLGRK